MKLLLQSPIRCYDEPSASGLAPRTLNILHEYASRPHGSARWSAMRLSDFATNRHEYCGLAGRGETLSAEQRFDGLHIWDNRKTLLQPSRTRHARLAGKARHGKLGLARLACRARRARHARERLAEP
jgi:hypothetical protein